MFNLKGETYEEKVMFYNIDIINVFYAIKHSC